MSFDLQCWTRSLALDPSDEDFDERLEEYGGLNPGPAAPEMQAFIDALLARFPADPGEDAPIWALLPLRAQGREGCFISLNVRWDAAGDVIAFIRQLMHTHDILCYDAQSGEMLTPEPLSR